VSESDELLAEFLAIKAEREAREAAARERRRKIEKLADAEIEKARERRLAMEQKNAARALAREIVNELARRHQPSKHKRGAKETDVSPATRRKVAELRIGGETVAGIMRKTRLSKTVATRLVRQIDGVLGTLKAGRY
jgi:hypothetical protein